MSQIRRHRNVRRFNAEVIVFLIALSLLSLATISVLVENIIVEAGISSSVSSSSCHVQSFKKKNQQQESVSVGDITYLIHDYDDTDNGNNSNNNNDVGYTTTSNSYSWKRIERGGGFGLSRFVPAGYNPFGYKISELGLKFLELDGSLNSDVGRFLASVKASRKRFDTIKSQWIEIVRVSKAGQSMRIYRNLEDLIAFCLKAKLLD